MSWRCFFENVGVALLFNLCAFASLQFSVGQANASPIWLPSGVMLALVLTRGSHIWPGILLGAFAKSMGLNFSPDLFFQALAAATTNGIGDTFGIIFSATLISHFLNGARIISNEKTLLIFILFGVILGPLVCTTFSLLGLLVTGFLPITEFSKTFLIWWFGDAASSIIITPFLIAWLNPDRFFDHRSIASMCLTIPFSMLITALTFDVLQFHRHLEYSLFLMLPMFFITLFRHGQRQVFSVQVAVLLYAIIATKNGYGVFANDIEINAILQLQAFAAAFSLIMFAIAILNLEKTHNEEKLEKRTIELEELYRKDALTNLWNRYRIKEFLELELARFKRTQKAFGVLMLDIDDFKKINDSYGHLKGDEVLVALAQLIENNIRGIDLVGRWGGEEFIIIISDTQPEALVVFADKLHTLIRSHKFIKCQPVTVSIGGALSTEQDTELTLLDRADAALYSAKNNGKNQAVFNID